MYPNMTISTWDWKQLDMERSEEEGSGETAFDTAQKSTLHQILLQSIMA